MVRLRLHWSSLIEEAATKILQLAKESEREDTRITGETYRNERKKDVQNIKTPKRTEIRKKPYTRKMKITELRLHNNNRIITVYMIMYYMSCIYRVSIVYLSWITPTFHGEVEG